MFILCHILGCDLADLRRACVMCCPWKIAEAFPRPPVLKDHTLGGLVEQRWWPVSRPVHRNAESHPTSSANILLHMSPCIAGTTTVVSALHVLSCKCGTDIAPVLHVNLLCMQVCNRTSRRA